MPYELITFDCDGVLVDSERIAVKIESEGLIARDRSLQLRQPL